MFWGPFRLCQWSWRLAWCAFWLVAHLRLWRAGTSESGWQRWWQLHRRMVRCGHGIDTADNSEAKKLLAVIEPMKRLDPGCWRHGKGIQACGFLMGGCTPAIACIFEWITVSDFKRIHQPGKPRNFLHRGIPDGIISSFTPIHGGLKTWYETTEYEWRELFGWRWNRVPQCTMRSQRRYSGAKKNSGWYHCFGLGSFGNVMKLSS